MRILFLGEDGLSGAGRYLAAVLRWSRISFDYRPDGAPVPRAWETRRYDAVLLSDYRRASWTPPALRWLAQRVHEGTGLFMVGGWASFTGQVGRYQGSLVESLLPVRCVAGDDRVHRAALLATKSAHPVVVNGYHRSRPKAGSLTRLSFREILIKQGRLSLGKARPALVTGRHGRGRTAAFLTDAAPHWAGGLVDWGQKRVIVKVGTGASVEAGEAYLQFFRRWIGWVARRT